MKSPSHVVGVAQLGRAPDCGSGGRGFESHHPPQTKTENKGLGATSRPQTSSDLGPRTKRPRPRLLAIDNAKTSQDFAAIPGHHLEALKGARKGQHSVRVNDQYRVCFTWSEPHADGVEIVDYH